MVDVSGKAPTFQTATATGVIEAGQEILTAVSEGNVKKGDVLGVPGGRDHGSEKNL